MRRNRGFTLIELLILSIIGVLAAIALPMYLAQRHRAKDAALKGGMHNSQLGLASYAVDHVDVYPAVVADSAALVDSGIDSYVDHWPLDPWTANAMVHGVGLGDYIYTQSGGGAAFTLAGHLSTGDFVVS